MFETLNEQEWEQVDRVWDLLDEGEFERARLEADALLQRRGSHPDLKVVDAAVAIDEGRAEYALHALHGAEASADPALFFHLRSLARFHLVQVEAARDDAEQALAIRPDLAEACALLAKIHDFLGDAERAAEYSDIACELDSEAFPLPLDVDDEAFDRLVDESLQELPARVREHLEEIPVIVESVPAREVLTAEQPPLPPDLLGLFVGRHLLERRHDDLPGSPGAIYLFRKNLLRHCRDREELTREVRITVQHEVGHLLGLDEDDLEAWGLA